MKPLRDYTVPDDRLVLRLCEPGVRITLSLKRLTSLHPPA